jgi:xanthine dehydrogenase small subunit
MTERKIMDSEYTLECIINDTTITTRALPGIALLDFLRRTEHLTGTKEGCREGDCGACTVLLGELRGDAVVYKTVNSCLLPLGDVYGKHVVTIEGVNQPEGLNPIQQAIVDDVGTQCGFCTPGFILSLTGCCIDFPAALSGRGVHASNTEEHRAAFEKQADDAVDGNICRCTGHTPIKKAVRRIGEYLSTHPQPDGMPLAHLVGQKILPEYFLGISRRLQKIGSHSDSEPASDDPRQLIVAGGTDLYVQKQFTMHAQQTVRISSQQNRTSISEDDDSLSIPGTTTVEEFRSSAIVGRLFPEIRDQLLVFGSSPIRHRATIGGNIANASPIGDMTCLLMALDATIELQDGGAIRRIPLRKLYTGYKRLDKKPTELIRAVLIAAPGRDRKLSFEKVSRRQYLDIASVNSAMSFDLVEGRMDHVGISAGGVGPTMLHLSRTSEIISGKLMNADVLARALEEAQSEISPISDARGSADYKRLLLRQLIAAHVMKYFPDVVKKEAFI